MDQCKTCLSTFPKQCCFGPHQDEGEIEVRGILGSKVPKDLVFVCFQYCVLNRATRSMDCDPHLVLSALSTRERLGIPVFHMSNDCHKVQASSEYDIPS